MEACKAVAEVVHRQLDAIPALKEMLAELPPADHVDDGGLGGNDGGGSRVAIEAIREMTDEVARTGDFHHLLGAVVVAHRVLETACLDVTKQAGAPPPPRWSGLPQTLSVPHGAGRSRADGSGPRCSVVEVSYAAVFAFCNYKDCGVEHCHLLISKYL